MPLLKSHTLTLSIHRPPAEVYAFVRNGENLPRWATGFCRSVRKTEDGWTVETPNGEVSLRFVEENPFGVLDHHVTLPSGEEILVPMRVLPNASGSELLFTLFQPPEMTDAEFARDRGMVEQDLSTLRRVLEE